jgi:hypothetical protein
VDDEVQVAAVQSDIDATRRHLGSDLGGGLGDRLHHRQPGRRVEREPEPLRGLAHLLAGTLDRGGQVAAEAVDVRRDVHAHHYDTTMTSRQGRHDVISVRSGVRGQRHDRRARASVPAKWVT